MSFVIPSLTSVEVTAATEKFAWKSQLIVFDVNPPTFNTLHEVFHKTGGVRVNSFRIQQENTPTDGEEIDILITIDGRTILYDSSVVNMLADLTTYSMWMGIALATLTNESEVIDTNINLYPIYTNSTTLPYSGYAMSGHDIKIEVRQTSPIEAGARIRVNALVETLEAV